MKKLFKYVPVLAAALLMAACQNNDEADFASKTFKLMEKTRVQKQHNLPSECTTIIIGQEQTATATSAIRMPTPSVILSVTAITSRPDWWGHRMPESLSSHMGTVWVMTITASMSC